MTRHLVRSICTLAGRCSLAAALLASFGPAQESRTEIAPDRGFHPAHTYSLSDIQTLDMGTGAVGVQLPLAALPPSPAGLSAGFRLVYTSKYWETRPHPGIAADGSDKNTWYQLVKGSEAWRLSWKYEIQPVYVEAPEDGVCEMPRTTALMKLKILSPDGSKHVLRLRGMCAEGVLWTGDSRANQNQTQDQYWFSTDGSFLRLTMYAGTNWPNNPWRLWLRDGTEVYNNGSVQTITDRNGYQIRISSEDADGVIQTVIKDPVGRMVTMYDDTTAGRSYVYAYGVNGAKLTWTVSWGYTDVIPAVTQYYCLAAVMPGYCSYPQELKVATGVTLPTGLSYSFQHAARYGELSELKLSAGATEHYRVQYAYQLDPIPSMQWWYAILANAPASKTVTYLDKLYGGPETWTYNFQTEVGNTTETAPDGGVTTYVSYPADYRRGTGGSFAGLVRHTTKPDGSVFAKAWAENILFGVLAAGVNPWVKAEYEHAANAGRALTRTSAVIYSVDKNGNRTATQKYDWTAYNPGFPNDGSIPSGSALIRQVQHTYKYATADSTSTADEPNLYNSESPSAPKLISLVASEDTVGLSRTEFTYDSRGNVLTERVWNSEKGGLSTPLSTANSDTVTHTYDAATGNRTQTTDAKNYITKFDYGSIVSCSFGSTNQYSANASGWYATAETRALGTAAQQGWNYSYDACTGLRTASTDPNSVTTSTAYDTYGRPLMVREGTIRATRTRYSDADRWVKTCRDQNGLDDQKTIEVRHYDGLGQLRMTRQLEAGGSSACESTWESLSGAGIKTQRAYRYESGGRFEIASNPYRDMTESTMGWTLTAFDQAGRIARVSSYAGAALPPTFGGANGNTSGETTSAYDVTASGRKVLVTDPAGKKRESHRDAAGRLTQVVEGPGGVGYVTTYRYNGQDLLTGVCQGAVFSGSSCPAPGQTRTFAYSSLQRMTSAANPENGPTSYSYDANGNLLTKTDARGVTMTLSGYDGLNRPARKSYSGVVPPVGATPDVTYTYDACGFGKGRLCTVANSNSSTSYAYDALGRATSNAQTTGSNSYSFQYGYNAAGALTRMVYPAGTVVSYLYDDLGRPTAVKKGEAGSTDTYVSIAVGDYHPHGPARQMTLGTRVEQSCYNDRLQVVGLRVGTAAIADCGYAAANDLLNLTFGYGTRNNNGNLQSQTIRAPKTDGSMWTLTQSYGGYDDANRLTSAAESGAGLAWSQGYSYGQFGNRVVSGDVVSMDLACGSYDAGTNRCNSAGFGYDSAGNLTGYKSRTLKYDAENRQTELIENGTTFTYAYDGEGRRVKKIASGNTTTYVYDAFGQLAAEYSTQPGTDTGRRYLTTDHLGSTRLIVDVAGAMKNRYDYFPFGQEIPGGYGDRTMVAGYACNGCGGDSRNPKFTGHYRDYESGLGLDYFGARYFSGAQGRFTSPDEFTGGIVDPFTGQQVGQPGPLPYADITDPQTLNKYAYVRNNPLRYVDPDGHDWDDVVETVKAGIDFTAGVGRGIAASATFGLVGAPAESDTVASRAGQAVGTVLTGAGGLEMTAGGTGAILTTAGAATPVAAPVAAAGAAVSAGAAKNLGAVLTTPMQKGRSGNDVKPDPNATGAHSVPKRDASGKVVGYTEFNAKGGATKRLDKTGASHGGVPTPHVHEPKPGKGPGAPLRHVRPARPDEIPN